MSVSSPPAGPALHTTTTSHGRTSGSLSPIVITVTSWPRSTRYRENSGPWVAGPPTSGGQMPVRKTIRMKDADEQDRPAPTRRLS